MNKSHYTYFARSTSGKIVQAFHKVGARMHFNHIELEKNSFVEQLNGGKECKTKLRYGVINMDDLMRDLEHWETLLSSSFMQRPHETLVKGN